MTVPITAWFQDERWYDLIVILDDASSEIYYAQLVEEESTVTVMVALREVVEGKGLFCALYSDRGSHFWLTPKAGGKVDRHRLTQVGRALAELGIQMIPAYSPQARGRSERNFGTWQGRLPQELRLHGIDNLEEANRFLREYYMAEFNRRFQVRAAERGTAFLPRRGQNLDLTFSLQFERAVNRDNTVSFQHLRLQIEPVRWRATLARERREFFKGSSRVAKVIGNPSECSVWFHSTSCQFCATENFLKTNLTTRHRLRKCFTTTQQNGEYEVVLSLRSGETSSRTVCATLF